MCGDCFRIKVCNRFAPNKVAVKCGICKECRQIEQNSWAFRLRCELEDCHNKGWKIGFITLTFDDEHLPHIPDELINHSLSPDRSFPCFSKSLMRDFIVKLRKTLYDDYDIGKNKDGIKYLVCSEYGKSTKRPHHHAVFSFPPKISSEDFYNIVKSKWTYGFVFPKNLNGGCDSHGYYHQPFEVISNPLGASKYIAKYISKDIDFFNSVSDLVPVDGADLRDYFPFHLQSKSLGFSRLCGLSDDQKLDFIVNGYSFIGSDKLIPIPLYFRRRLLFSPRYVVERDVFSAGHLVNVGSSVDSLSDSDLENLGFTVKYRRLVRRETTDFFKKYYPQIFRKQHKTYVNLFDRITNLDYLESRNSSRGLSSFSSVCKDVLDYTFHLFGDTSSLAAYYLAYYGLPFEKCFDVEPEYQWFMRYDDNFAPPPEFFRIDRLLYEDINFCIGSLMRLALFDKLEYSDLDLIAGRVSDFWKSAI